MSKKSYKLINSKTKNEFLNYFLRTGSISRAAEKSGLSRQAHYDWLKNDKTGEYHRAWAKVNEMYTDYLEEVAAQRATTGREVRVYYQGKLVDTRYEPSDNLLKFLLEGRRPEKYRAAAVEVNQNVNLDISDAVAAARQRVAKANGQDQ